YGLGHHRGPHRYGREGHHQHQDLHRRPPPAGPRSRDDVLREERAREKITRRITPPVAGGVIQRSSRLSTPFSATVHPSPLIVAWGPQRGQVGSRLRR